jgi:hypothetical protein
MFHEYVLAGDSNVGGTELHIGGYIGGANNHQLDVVLIGIKNQLAAFFRIFSRNNIGRCQQGKRLFVNSTFG